MSRRRAFSLSLAAAVLAAAIPPAGRTADPPRAVTGVALPEGYRAWAVLAPSHRTDKGHLRLILGNEVAARAAREKTLPFPEGSVLAKLVYQAVKSPEWEEALVPGEPVVVEFMVKDTPRYGPTGGWGFGRFTPGGEPLGDEALYKTCFPCHEAHVKDNDFVFTRWAR